MKKGLMAAIIGVSIIACPIMYALVGPALSHHQIEILKVLIAVTACSALYCFVAGELATNNSQMDKLWSLLPIAYVWIVAGMGGMDLRLVVMAVLTTLWGARLTFNFGRKGAYSIRFWSGEEDYRWVKLRQRKEFQPRWKWMIFDLLFISIYQNVLVLMITFPALLAVDSARSFGLIDGVAAVLMLGCIVYETIADEQQWKFQSRKHAMLKEGKKLEELPLPYRLGFNTTGLWGVSRHPNYLAEQSTWVALYLFTIGAGLSVFNWSMIGALLLIVLFIGSTAVSEEMSAGKYADYRNYIKNVNKYWPGKRYESQQ